MLFSVRLLGGHLKRITGRIVALVTAVAFCQAAWASFVFGDVGDFNGTFSSAISPPLTIGCYVKYTNHATGAAITEIGQSPTSSTQAHRIATGSASDAYIARTFDASAASLATYTAAAGTYDGVWHGVVAKFTSATARAIYVGALGNTASDSASRTVNTVDDYTIGEGNNASQVGFTGKAAECFVMDAAISDADISAFMSLTRPSCFAGAADVVGYYSLSTNDTTPNDESGNGGPTLAASGTTPTFDADHPTMSCPSSGAEIMLRRRR